MFCVCYCYVALPHDAVGWSAACDCGISIVVLTCSLLFFWGGGGEFGTSCVLMDACLLIPPK